MENDVLKHRMAVISNIEKSFGEDIVEKGFEDEVNPFEYAEWENGLTKAELDEFEKAKHQDGDMHPNGKWVWRQSANGGKGDWRVANPKRGGRAKKTAAAPTSSTAASQKKADDKKTYAAKEADAYDKGDGKIGNYPKPTVNVGKPARQLYNLLDKNRYFHFKYGMPSDEIMKKLKTYQGNVVYSYHANAGTDEIYRIEFK